MATDILITPAAGTIDFNNGTQYSINGTIATMEVDDSLTAGNLSIHHDGSGVMFLDRSVPGNVFEVFGSYGTLFAINDDLSNSLFSVNNAAGQSVFEVFANNTIVGGAYGANSFYLDTNGNLGLGTASPTRTLHIKGDNKVFLLSSNDYEVATIGPRGSSGSNLDAGILGVKANGTFKAVIDAAGSTYFNGGSVGVGTTSPSSLLQIGAGSFPNPTTSYDIVHLGGLSLMGRSNRDVYISANAYYATSGWLVKYGGYQPLVMDMLDGRFVWNIGTGTTAGSSAGMNEIMRLNTTGLGIGTPNPGYKLHVNGNGSTLNNTFYVDVGNYNGATVLFEHTGSATPVPFMIKKSGYSGSSQSFGILQLHMDHSVVGGGSNLYFTLDDSAGNVTEYGGLGAFIQDATNGSEDGALTFMTTEAGSARQRRMTILNNGNVGIGITVPVAPLHVSSTANNIARFSGTGAAGTYIKIDESGTKAWVIGLNNGSSTLHIRENDYNGTAFLSVGTAELIVNEDSSNYDFRVEGDADANLLVCDASANAVGIGTASPLYKLDVRGSFFVDHGETINTGLAENKSYSSVNTGTAAADNWYPIYTMQDSLCTPVTFHVKTYAHSGMCFTVSRGYYSGSITVINHHYHNNGSYANIKGARIRDDGVVEINLYWSTSVTYTYVHVSAIGSGFYLNSLNTSLVKTTSSPTIDDTYNGVSNFMGAGRFTALMLGGTDAALDRLHVEGNGRLSGSIGVGGAPATSRVVTITNIAATDRPAIKIVNPNLSSNTSSTGKSFYRWLPIDIDGTTRWLALYQ